MFEKAVRMKLRITTHAGHLGVEDLWDLTVEQLDAAYKTLKRRVAEMDEDSLLDKPTAEDEALKLKVAIVTHIVATKLAEAQAREDAVEREAERNRLLEILAGKEDKALQKLSRSEIRRRIDELSP
jgi:hypothetical protein